MTFGFGRKIGKVFPESILSYPLLSFMVKVAGKQKEGNGVYCTSPGAVMVTTLTQFSSLKGRKSWKPRSLDNILLYRGCFMWDISRQLWIWKSLWSNLLMFVVMKGPGASRTRKESSKWRCCSCNRCRHFRDDRIQSSCRRAASAGRSSAGSFHRSRFWGAHWSATRFCEACRNRSEGAVNICQHECTRVAVRVLWEHSIKGVAVKWHFYAWSLGVCNLHKDCSWEESSVYNWMKVLEEKEAAQNKEALPQAREQ